MRIDAEINVDVGIRKSVQPEPGGGNAPGSRIRHAAQANVRCDGGCSLRLFSQLPGADDSTVV
jgi:hypothetical protein